MIKIKTYTINNSLLTHGLLSTYIDLFWKEIFEQLMKGPSVHYLMLMCKIAYNGHNIELGYRTLGHLRRVNYSDKELFTEYLQERLGLLNDSYTSNSLNEISFSYIIKDGVATDNRRLLQDVSDKSLATHRFNNINLPISMVPSDYGKVIGTTLFESENFTRYFVTDNRKVFQLDISLDGLVNNVTILGASDLNWTDTKLTEGFKREIGKSTIYFVDGETVLRKQLLNAKPFRKLVPDKYVTTSFLTMDIETIKLDTGKLSPYLICAYDGQDYITSYNNNPKALFASFMEQLISKIKPGLTVVYAHNLSAFDGIFIMRHLFEFGEVMPLIDDARIICIKVVVENKESGKNKNKTIIFKDSYLLLPMPLRALCTTFNIVMAKAFFPFKLTNIFYTGVFPKFENWIGITLTQYELLKKPFRTTFWDFQKEATKYCKLDCQVLHQILVKFNELIFKEFQINIHNKNVFTLPSLAMRIYKAHFMPKDSIYQILGKPEWFIRHSYTGGAVDVYIPHNRITRFIGKVKALFKLLFYYDVNSLYPSVMANTPMPIGKPIAFQGDIRALEPNAYGFFYCKISSPEYLEHPLLQQRVKTASGIRTIAGLGSWEGWINSAEMDNAINFGYTFEILKGYQFETGDIFSGYINRMYNLRMEYPKGDAMNYIAKLLMNSLYGRFAMKLERKSVSIYNVTTENAMKEFKDMVCELGESIEDWVNIGTHFIIIRDSFADIKYNENQDMFHGQDINIAIASAITAGGRVHMSIFKNNPEFNLYYSDTDSGVTDAPLPSNMVGPELGKMKLEHTITRAVFLAPKVYGFIDIDGNEIIKVKGIKAEVAKELSIQQLELLLVKDSTREFTQEKWYKKLIEGEITVTDVIYTLKTTANKRSAIYDNQDGLEIYNSTKPYYYDDIFNNYNFTPSSTHSLLLY